MKKRRIAALMLVLIVTAWALHSFNKARRSAWNVIKNPETVQMLKQFVAWKKAEAYADTNGVLPEIQTMFREAENGDWLALSNSVQEINWRIDDWQGERHWHGLRLATKAFFREAITKISGKQEYGMPPYMRGACGEAIMEVHRAFCASLNGDEAYSAKFGREIIGSIPPGSIYFAGTDPGLFIVTVMSKSHFDGDPFFTVAQKSLAADPYRAHLLAIYGKKICVPTTADVQCCFDAYVENIGRSESRPQSPPSPDSVFNINALLCKFIFDQNTNCDFFVEEAYPVEWMRPNLEPHGLIFKINRQPLAELSDEMLRRDHDYWRKSLEPKIGGWLTEETPIETIAAFAKKIFLQHDLKSFTGDKRFVQNEYSCKMFSQERSSIAGLYAWRASHSANDSEKQRMISEADFAFRQAWALCPDAPETVFRYVNFLLERNRLDDAILIAETCKNLDPDDSQIVDLISHLKAVERDNAKRAELEAVARGNPANVENLVALISICLRLSPMVSSTPSRQAACILAARITGVSSSRRCRNPTCRAIRFSP